MSRRNDRGRLSRGSRLAACLAVACLVALGVIGPADPENDPGSAILIIGTIASLLAVGAVLAWRVPDNPIGSWLVLAGALVTGTAITHVAATAGALATPAPWPGAAWAELVGTLLEILPIAIVIVIIPLHFPDGRLPSPRWRWVQWLLVCSISTAAVGTVFGPGPYGDLELANPLAVPQLAPLVNVLGTVALIAAVPAFFGAAASLVVRYRHAGRVERQQLKWLAAVASVAAIAFTTSFIVPNETASEALYLLGYVSVAALPVAIGVAILRYRLYDIDRLISRTVSWTVVSAALVAVFAGGVVALQTVLAGVTQAEALAVAASTLVAAVMFQPLRLQVQRAVDRRFDRTAVDASRASAAFASRLRDEVDLETVTQDLVGTVDEVVRPASARLWLRAVGPNPTAS